MKVVELKASSQKSYYRKAFVLEDHNRNVFLQSYDTIVCGIVGGKFVRFWDDYSATTMHHINDFRRLHEIEKLNKKEWSSLPVKYNPVETPLLTWGIKTMDVDMGLKKIKNLYKKY